MTHWRRRNRVPLRYQQQANYPAALEIVLAFTAAVVIGCFAIVLVMILMASHGHARDDGRFAQSPLKSWFDGLKSQKGLCCSVADGVTIKDVDWESKDGHYRVRLDGEWIDVPDDAVVTEPNRYGPPVVWPITDVLGKTAIRCFIPGALS